MNPINHPKKNIPVCGYRSNVYGKQLDISDGNNGVFRAYVMYTYTTEKKKCEVEGFGVNIVDILMGFDSYFKLTEDEIMEHIILENI